MDRGLAKTPFRSPPGLGPFQGVESIRTEWPTLATTHPCGQTHLAPDRSRQGGEVSLNERYIVEAADRNAPLEASK